MAMRKNALKGLFWVRTKGNTYYYAWKGGPRILAEFGTKEFLEEFLAARSRNGNLDRSRFGAWVTLYKADEQGAGGRPYAKLSEATKRNWAPLLDNVKAHFGDFPIRLFDRPDIRVDIKHWRKQWSGTPRMADLAKQVLSRVCGYMVAEGKLSVNPCVGIDNLYDADRSEIIWTEADIAQLGKVAPKEIMWAVRLAAHTGLRQGDLLRLAWSRVGDLAIETTTSKSRSRRRVVIPMTAALRDALAGIPKRATTVLTNTFGRPWRTGFGASWQSALEKAGLKESGLHFHDLRGTAATNFYCAGLSSREIADILGWSQEQVESMLDRYVKRDELLLDRIRRMDRMQNANVKTGIKTGTPESG